MSEFPAAYQRVLNRPFQVVSYGVCQLEDLLLEVSESTVLVTPTADDVLIAIPKREQTQEEVEKTKQFAQEVRNYPPEISCEFEEAAFSYPCVRPFDAISRAALSLSYPNLTLSLIPINPRGSKFAKRHQFYRLPSAVKAERTHFLKPLITVLNLDDFIILLILLGLYMNQPEWGTRKKILSKLQ